MSSEVATAAAPADSVSSARVGGSWRELLRGGTGLLVVGLLMLEFATAMQYFAVAVVMSWHSSSGAYSCSAAPV
jgi:hypothetical protein